MERNFYKRLLICPESAHMSLLKHTKNFIGECNKQHISYIFKSSYNFNNFYRF